MDKRIFLENLLSNIRNMDIFYIISSYISLTRKGCNYLGLCPFHDDKTLGSFVVSPDKKIFKCFSCDIGGDAIRFVANFQNINYVEAAFEIGIKQNIITKEEYNKYFAKRFYSKKEVKNVEEANIKRYKETSNKADIKTLNYVFSLFINQMKLSEEHKLYLINKRMLSEEIIEKRKYKTYPTEKAFKNLIENLENNLEFIPGYKKSFNTIDELLSTIPGFYQRKISDIWTWSFPKNKGIILPLRNAHEEIVGLQVRRDEKDEENGRYIWFSSTFALYNDKFRNGTSSGSPIDVVFPKKIKHKYIFITEGRFKSEALVNVYGSPSISVQGVTSWRGIEKEIKEIVKILNKTSIKESIKILISFDSDWMYKKQVYNQLIKISKYLSDNFKDIEIKYLYWESDYKGIDDLLINLDKDLKPIKIPIKAKTIEEIKEIFKKKEESA